jgi:hypothetical protein
MPLLNITATVLHFIAMLNAYGEKHKNVSNAKEKQIKHSLISFAGSCGRTNEIHLLRYLVSLGDSRTSCAGQRLIHLNLGGDYSYHFI